MCVRFSPVAASMSWALDWGTSACSPKPKVLKPDDRALLELLRWSFYVANNFFHIVYGQGVWMSRGTAQNAVDLGFSVGDTWVTH